MTGRVALLLVVLSLAPTGCDKQKQDKQEQLTIVVEADRSKLAQQEAELRRRYEELQQERQRLRQEKETILSQRLGGGLGREQARLLSKRERELLEREKQMLQREQELEKERRKLTGQVDQLLGKLAGQGGAAAAAPVANREASLARREKSLATREAELARREAELARREAELARREADFLKTRSRLAAVAVPAPSRGSQRTVSSKAVNRLYQGALARMRKRGLLAADLPLEEANLIGELRAAMKAGDWSTAQTLAQRLDVLVKATNVDAGFIERKLQRLSRLRAQAKLGAADAKRVSALFRQATRFYSDGRYALANRELNKIFSLLSK